MRTSTNPNTSAFSRTTRASSWLRALATLVVGLTLVLVSRTSFASNPAVHIGTAPVLAEFGPGTHLKFITYTLYDRPYTPAGDAKVLHVWHGWAPSNNEISPGVPKKGYFNATFRDGSPVPHVVEGNGGHGVVSTEMLHTVAPAAEAMAGEGKNYGMMQYIDHEVVVRAGGVTVDGNGNVVHLVSTSGTNSPLNTEIYGYKEATYGDVRKLDPREAKIYEDQVRNALATADKESLLLNAPCECFVAGTAIATARGRKRIEDVEVGDDVWSMGMSGEPELHRVVHTMVDPPRPTRWVTLSKDGHRERLETTDEHPFYVVGAGWTIAEKLAAGNMVATKSGETATVEASETTDHSRPTFNFEVEGAHNYFVGSSQALVHNSCATAKRQARVGRMARIGQMHVGSAGGGTAGLLAGFIASYAGQSVGGEVGALGAAFGAAAVMNRIGGSSWRLSAGSAGASVGAGFLTSYALKAAGIENRFVHMGSGILAGAAVDGAIAYGTWTAAAGGTAAGAAGTAMVSSGLWGVLAAEVVYHGSQWYEIYQLNVNAANGDPAAQDALNEITFGGWLSPYNPNTYLLYGAYSWLTRPGEVLSDLWRNGL